MKMCCGLFERLRQAVALLHDDKCFPNWHALAKLNNILRLPVDCIIWKIVVRLCSMTDAWHALLSCAKKNSNKSSHIKWFHCFQFSPADRKLLSKYDTGYWTSFWVDTAWYQQIQRGSTVIMQWISNYMTVTLNYNLTMNINKSKTESQKNGNHAAIFTHFHCSSWMIWANRFVFFRSP